MFVTEEERWLSVSNTCNGHNLEVLDLKAVFLTFVFYSTESIRLLLQAGAKCKEIQLSMRRS
jgi:Ran GTPase-activating protein (RanGAP) involved in mRNA processing and transport